MRLSYLIVILSLFGELHAQCVGPVFSVSSNVCRNETLEIVNEIQPGVTSYEWDFCSGDMTVPPVVNQALTNESFYRARSIRFVKAQETWHAFAISATANNLIRLDFEAGIESVPTFHDMGTLGGVLSSAFSFDAIQVDGVWHLFVANTGSKNIVRLTFGEGLMNAPTVQILETSSAFANAGPNFIRIVKDGIAYYAFVSVGNALSNTKVVRLDFGISINNANPALAEFAVSGSNQLRGMSFSKECGKWVGLALSSNTNALYRLTFNDGLDSPPITSVVNTASLVLNTPVNIEIVNEGSNYYAVIQNARIEESNAALYRISLGQSLTGSVQSAEKLQIPELTGGAYALDIVEENSSQFAFTFNLASKTLLRMVFASVCPTTTSVSFARDPEGIVYQSAGSYSVTLKVTDANGNTSSKSQNIVVSSLQAPAIDATSENVCAQYDISFFATSSDQIETFAWSFGDGATSSEPNPVHAYSSEGLFNVTLRVIGSDNGCGNLAVIPLTVYKPPEAAFSLPSQMLCTNNTFLFETTTPDTYNGNLSYQWYVDDNPVSTTRDLEYSFADTGPKSIKLKTSIPGCSDEVTQVTSSVEPGPVVDFSFAGACEDDHFAFQQEISDPVVAYRWNFGDGNIATDPATTHQFPAFGEYSVSLTATNAIGCENSITKSIPVYAKPVVDFTAEGPPNTCSGTSTEFQNLTASPDGSEITVWLWDFGDPDDNTSQTKQHPQHTFQNPGTYTVALTATSEMGCQRSGAKDILISRSPSRDFTFTPACEDVPVQFRSSDDNTVSQWYWEIGTAYYMTPAPTHTFQAPGDYPLYLELVAANGCVSRVNETIHVPAPLRPDFTTVRNCIGQEAVFSDVTVGIDPPVARQWYRDGVETGGGASLAQVFTEAGSHVIALRVTTASGCIYSVEKPVTIGNPPTASFSATPAVGAWPLNVQFSNTSQGATHYRWEFLDGTAAVSNEASPEHIFSEEGSFEVVLTAFNEQECTDVHALSITTEAPHPDGDIGLITTTPNPDGSLKLIITVVNKGNTVLKDVPVDIDFSGNLTLRQMLEGPVSPGRQANVMLNTGILNADALRYLCVYLNMEHDVFPAGNESCKPFTSATLYFSPHPNPATDAVNVEWVSPAGTMVRLALTDLLGRKVFSADVASAVGLNRQTLNVAGLPAGIYILTLDDGKSKISQRILVSGNP